MTFQQATFLLLGMSYANWTPPAYTITPRQWWTKRDFFEQEVDWYCQREGKQRFRSKEWVEFTERFIRYCENWNGCWVAETAYKEFVMYLSLPDGAYEPEEYPEGHHFYRT